MPKFDAVPTGLPNLIVFSINAGRVGTKLPHLLALLVDIAPNLVGVQEAGDLFAHTALRGVSYRVILGVVFPGGSPALHSRLWTHRHPRVEALEHSLIAYLPGSEKVSLVMSTVHFPLGMPAPDRRIHIRVAVFHAKYPGSIEIIFGDLNTNITGGPRPWLRRLCDDQR